MNDAFLSFLGLAVKAGKLARGFDAVLGSIREKKAFAVFIAADISEKSAENILFHAGKNNIQAKRVLYTIAEISHATGKPAGIVSVTDKNLGAKALILSSDTGRKTDI